MNNGVDLTSKKRFTKGYGYFTEMETYEDLLAAWDKTVREMTRYSVIVENAIDKASERDVPDVLCSALTDDCIGRGKTIKEGGAVYDFISGLQVGIANMADSLAAIKKLVYEEKKITKQQLWDAILDNFQSPENKKIQEMLSKLPPITHYEAEPAPIVTVDDFDDHSVIIKNVNGIYTVEADWLLQVMKGINFDDYESLNYFQKVLINGGVIDALRKKGCSDGDTVSIYELEFDFMD